MDKVLTLHQLQKNAMRAGTVEECAFHFVNKTYDLLPYDQAIFFDARDDDFRALQVSGHAHVEAKGRYAEVMKSIFQTHKDAGEICFAVTDDHIHERLRGYWAEIKAQHNYFVILKTEHEGALGGLLIQRSKAFSEAEQAILQELAEGYAQALALAAWRMKTGLLSKFIGGGRYSRYVWIGLLLLLCLPVRMNITAPAEVSAKDLSVINAPFQGMIEEILVEPGQLVEAGQILARMDEDDLESQAEAARKNLEIAEIDLARARREALSDPAKKAEISALRSEIEIKQIEYDYARTLLAERFITSPQDGIVDFADESRLRGKPVNAGEQIMLVAAPEQVNVLIRVPVDAMVPVAAQPQA